MKSRYGQFCPVAVASEIFAERWTPIILRELVLGSRGFNDIHRAGGDAQGARYHPLQEGQQKTLTARCALGLET